MEKEEHVFMRIQKQKKENWKKLCSKKGISLSSLIIDSVQNRIFDDEKRKILTFIESRTIFLQRLKPI
ncbi:hypothetical protein [Chryseobacterium lathyri]|jgi:hypothetical protein|uniref:hypothetical protein n=1 Tax=Chryseobacterium lathyri TaxID=395933 RepID=UPI001E41EBDD|nr:hypothetical protein [Chryseobacterium lathyri]